VNRVTVIPTTERAGTSVPALPRLAAGVLVIAGLVVVALVLVAGGYGFLGDEFYFVVTGRHLQAAAPDNPMLVPYLAAGWYALVGGHLWAFRILPALAAGLYVVLLPIIRPVTTRRSSRRAQGRSSIGRTHGCGVKCWWSAC
jgi:hypothetical protein